MNYKPAILGVLAYTLITFPLAVVWHVTLFEDKYIKFGYFQGEPDYLLGFLTILTQGVVLSFLYPYVKFAGHGPMRGLKYSLVIGIFFWSSHVLALIAKHNVPDSVGYLLLESSYLTIQFGIYGILIGLLYQRWPGEPA